MSETIETVKIQADNEHGYMIINKSDMKPDHKEWSDAPAKGKPGPKSKGE